VDEFKKDQGIDLGKDKMALQRLKEAAEKAKMELSTTTETEVNLPFITADASGPKHLQLKINRARFEQLVDDILRRTLAPCEKALADAGIKPGTWTRWCWWAAPPASPRSRRWSASSSARSLTRGSTPTRWWRWGRRSRRACWAGRSRTSSSWT
jgi:hypothetical protein